MVQPFLFAESTWIEVKDGNDTARELYDAHYSRYHYADGRKPLLFVGPGEKMVLLTQDARAVFAWRKFRSDDGQQGVNNCIFRNGGAGLSSELILEAMRLAWARWPGERLYTYVNQRAVKSRNHGYCYIKAGWRKCGVTKYRKHLIFEATPRLIKAIRLTGDDMPKDDLKFTELNPPERSRTYVYADGEEVTIRNVARICIRESGSNRVETTDGQKWIVLAGFKAVRIDVDSWTF